MGAAAAATTEVGGGAATATAAGSRPGLDPPTRGGEERRTRGLKLCPPRVLTMPGPKKGRRWREWEEEDFFAKEEKGFEMKMKGGGMGYNRWVRVGERLSPLNVHKWVLKLGLKNMEKLIYCAGNERLQKMMREEVNNARIRNFATVRNFAGCENSKTWKFLLWRKSPAFCFTCKTKNKIHENIQMKDREKHYEN